MPTIALKNLTEKQREVWQMRYRYGWRMKQIAIALGTTKQSVSKMLITAQLRAGLPRKKNIRLIRTQPRLARTQSLSTVFNI